MVTAQRRNSESRPRQGDLAGFDSSRGHTESRHGGIRKKDVFRVFFGDKRFFPPRSIDIRLRREKIVSSRKILRKTNASVSCLRSTKNTAYMPYFCVCPREESNEGWGGGRAAGLPPSRRALRIPAFAGTGSQKILRSKILFASSRGHRLKVFLPKTIFEG